MKIISRILALIAALTFGIQPALAGFLLNSFAVAPSVPATVSFVGCTRSTSDLTTYTFTTHATGTAGTRKTIVGVSAIDSATDYSTSSMTVGGASATEVVDSADTGSLVQSSIYIIDNPSGTTANIVVTMSEAVTALGICVWAAYDLGSETATGTAAQFQTASEAITLDLNVNAGGVGVGMSAVNFATSQATTWTGMTENADAELDQGPASVDAGYSGASTATAGTPLAVTTDWNGTGDAIGVSASFR